MARINSLSIDIESFSTEDLSKCSVYRYSESDSFNILLFGVSVNNGPVHVYDVASGQDPPDEILRALSDPTVTKWAFHAAFERVCLSVWLRRKHPQYFNGYATEEDPCHMYLNPVGWKCSMIWCAYMGLPLSLAKAGEVLGLDKQKMEEGKDLIRYFCMPCKPTKANGGRSRNLPKDAPDKWNIFKRYNVRDVETEMEIQKHLQNWPVPESVWKEYWIDQSVNDRGIGIDEQLVDNAIAINEKVTADMMVRMKEITGLENPGSVVQLMGWLKAQGVQAESLDKKHVAKLLKSTDGQVKEILELRQMVSKTSIKKYTAMKNAECSDHRIRGMFQFYGASRSGRWAGRIVQLQNLARNSMPDLEQARELVRMGDYESLQMLYDNIPQVLSELIRTALVPRPGYKFVVADYSSVEARALAFMAGETHTINSFAKGEDIYCATASAMFGVPVVKHGINGELRQKGKIATLACIAEGQLVLTNHGEKPIEDVQLSDKVWDGEHWVKHEGVIFKGKREVITYEGLTATPDHLVFVEGRSEPVELASAAESGSHLVQSGYCGKAIRLGKNNKSGKTLGKRMEPMQGAGSVSGLRRNKMDYAGKSAARKIHGLSALFSETPDTRVAVQTSDRRKAEMYESERPAISELRWTWDKIQFFIRKRSGNLSHKDLRFTRSGTGTGSDKQSGKLRAGKHPICFQETECSQQKKHSIGRVLSRLLALFKTSCYKEAFSRDDKRRNYSGCRKSCTGEKEKLAYHKRTSRLYDIRNAGPNHRFTVSGKLVHNCGYGGSVGALKAMGALDMGLHEEELQGIVDKWRNANPHIVRFWYDVEKAAKDCIRMHSTIETHGFQFVYTAGMMLIELPSGRHLTYIHPRIEENRFGSESITYVGTGQTRKWERIETFGGKLVENITQAVCRDILAYAMQTLSSAFIC
ncbi:DNA polymerase, partial [Lactimicrobium sp.]|uniref:DNA polymerase n=1 Tax=Lactimicrobium sp. TaxID=2563780 RepID=UPI002F3552E0